MLDLQLSQKSAEPESSHSGCAQVSWFDIFKNITVHIKYLRT